MMNKQILKNILHKQSELLSVALEDKLYHLMNDDDFNADILEQADVEESDFSETFEKFCPNDNFETPFSSENGGFFTKGELNTEDGADPIFSSATRKDSGLDIIYSHRAESLAVERPTDRVASYRQKIASLRGISMASDYQAKKNTIF